MLPNTIFQIALSIILIMKNKTKNEKDALDCLRSRKDNMYYHLQDVCVIYFLEYFQNIQNFQHAMSGLLQIVRLI